MEITNLIFWLEISEIDKWKIPEIIETAIVLSEAKSPLKEPNL